MSETDTLSPAAAHAAACQRHDRLRADAASAARDHGAAVAARAALIAQAAAGGSLDPAALAEAGAAVEATGLRAEAAEAVADGAQRHVERAELAALAAEAERLLAGITAGADLLRARAEAADAAVLAARNARLDMVRAAGALQAAMQRAREHNQHVTVGLPALSRVAASLHPSELPKVRTVLQMPVWHLPKIELMEPFTGGLPEPRTFTAFCRELNC